MEACLVNSSFVYWLTDRCLFEEPIEFAGSILLCCLLLLIAAGLTVYHRHHTHYFSNIDF